MAHAVHEKGAAAISRQDLNAFADLYAANAVVNDPSYPEPLKGRDAVRKDIADFVTAFPDLRVTADTSIASGNIIAAEWTMTGTHKGPLPLPTGSIAATNKPFRMKVATFERLDGDGRIVEERRYYDLAGMMEQLGITQ